MGGRRKGRELALQMLFQWDLSKESFHSVCKTFWTLHHEAEEDVREFADRLVEGTVEKVDPIDVLLARHAEHGAFLAWPQSTATSCAWLLTSCFMKLKRIPCRHQ